MTCVSSLCCCVCLYLDTAPITCHFSHLCFTRAYGKCNKYFIYKKNEVELCKVYLSKRIDFLNLRNEGETIYHSVVDNIETRHLSEFHLQLDACEFIDELRYHSTVDAVIKNNVRGGSGPHNNPVNG